jgi:hypothetical protein
MKWGDGVKKHMKEELKQEEGTWSQRRIQFLWTIEGSSEVWSRHTEYAQIALYDSSFHITATSQG